MKALLSEEEKAFGRKETYHIETFGCQMNAKDSEKFAGILEEIGYQPTEAETDADSESSFEAIAAEAA
jgi:tRNA-2-methylthio-N6-dimethylallyladenosine synthase